MDLYKKYRDMYLCEMHRTCTKIGTKQSVTKGVGSTSKREADDGEEDPG